MAARRSPLEEDSENVVEAVRLCLLDDILNESGGIEEVDIGSGMDEDGDDSWDGGDLEIAEGQSFQRGTLRTYVADQFGTLEAL